MTINDNKIRILFFIGSLRAGGKERRLIELLSYLRDIEHYEPFVILTLEEIHYPKFLELGIPYQVLNKKWQRNDPTIFLQVYQTAKTFKPHLIHTWGSRQTFYALPTSIGLRIPLVNSQITSAPPVIKKFSFDYIINQINFSFSKIILANSRAGLESFRPPKDKSRVIYNGLNMTRFVDLPEKATIKKKYGIHTPYTVVMVGSVSPNKDYRLFFDIAQHITQTRDDISFIGVGWYIEGEKEYERIRAMTRSNSRLLFPGNIDDVEALVNSCDIGVLFSPNGEGLSNAILEYMALGKPVIANRIGGNTEIISHNENGFLVERQQSVEEIASMITGLIDDKTRCKDFGEKSRETIQNSFTLDRMGSAFDLAYKEVIAYKTAPVAEAPQFIGT